MKTAIAIKYGGVYTDADQCNELSYLQLGLVCPCCHQIVYWVPDQERTSKHQKTFSVGAHFRHPRSVSYEEALICSERVKQITSKERQKNLEKAKQQRARLFEIWFWQILDAHWFRCDLADFEVKKMLLVGAMEDDDGTQYLYTPTRPVSITINGFGKNLEVAIESSKRAFEMFGLLLSFQGKSQTFKVETLRQDDAVVNEIWAAFGALAQSPLHRSIVEEAIRFLGAKSNRHLVRALWYSFFVGSELISGSLIDSLEKYSKTEAAVIFYRSIGFLFALIPWADEFAKLSNQSDVPKVQSSYVGGSFQWFLKQFCEVSSQNLETPMTAAEFFLSPEAPPMKGMNFDEEIDPEAHRRSVNQLQFQGAKLLQSLKSKQKKAIGFGK